MKARITAAALGLAIAAPLAAHDLFMKLDNYYVPTNARVQVALLNGTFDSSEAAVRKERARSIDLVRAGILEKSKGISWNAKGDTSELSFKTSHAGTYVIGVSLLPRDISLSGDEFNAYLEEDAITATLEQRRANNELADSAHERYAKHVKAIFQVGDARSSGWNKRLGYPAELVPLENPYDITVGDTLRFLALVDRNPAPGIAVRAGFQRGVDKPVAAGTGTADSTGVVAIPITAAGKWYVKFISMRPVRIGKLNYESKWATLTFEVR